MRETRETPWNISTTTESRYAQDAMHPARDAVPAKAWRWLASSAIVLGAVVVMTFLCLAVPWTPPGVIVDDDGAAGVPEFDILGSMSLSWVVSLIGIPLWVRRENLLESPARKTLFRLVQAHPGIHLRGLVHASGLGFGAVSNHLRVLRDCGYVSAVPSGVLLCFYPAGVEPVSMIPRISRRRIQVLEAIEQSPGAGLGELGEALGLSPKTIAYHVRALRAAGWVDAEGFGRPLRLRRAPPDRMAQH